MSLPKPARYSDDSLQPSYLDQMFPPELQRSYTARLRRRGGLTQRRAEYFVRLWGYLLLKHHAEQGTRLIHPLTQLQTPKDAISCTHREAAELFYGNQDRGSDRAAGMMIDRLVALGLLEKHFDGQTLRIQVRAIPELTTELGAPEKSLIPIKLQPDHFNPRTDAIPIANLIARNYAELIRDTATTSHKIAKVLRLWAQQYPKGMRVLRRCDNSNPVAVCVIYPVATEAEFNFFQPPSKSFYLTSETEADPFKLAIVGDTACTSAYIRAWAIDDPYMQGENIYLMLSDTRQTLLQMQQDFPGLCDIYSLIIHPIYEELRQALGFQKTLQDTQRSYSWIYLALDHFLALNLKQVLGSLKSSFGADQP